MRTLDYRAIDWPADPVEAAELFYRDKAREVLEMLGPHSDLDALDAAVIIFPHADRTHCAWRLAVIQNLARRAAPRRVNGVVGLDDKAIDSTIAYLASAPGVTGQLLEVDGIPPARG